MDSERTYEVVVHWHPKPGYNLDIKSRSYWSTEKSSAHRIMIWGHFLPRGNFRVHIASCITIPEGQSPKQLRGLINVIRAALAQHLRCQVILQAEDVDWDSPPVVGHPRTTSVAWSPNFLIRGCKRCTGTMVLEHEDGQTTWHCLHCSRDREVS